MTEQEVIQVQDHKEYNQLIDDVAELYRLSPNMLKDWNYLMPLAIEHGLSVCFLDSLTERYVEVSDFDDDDILKTESLKNHPTKERAVAVAILKGLKAKKEK